MEPNQPINQPSKKLSPAVISIIVIALIAAAAGAVYVATKTNEGNENSVSTNTSNAESSNDTTTNESSDTSNDASYKDGTYTATGNYSTPGGRESVTVKVTLANGTISDASTDGSATGGNSAQYQSQFLNNYESLVVGKSIDSVSLSRVAGSSLTSGGFNSAIEQIKTDALS